jgi:hypothetical protein
MQNREFADKQGENKAMTDLSHALAAPSPGAERMRRHRERRRRSGVLIEFEVVGTALDGLIDSAGSIPTAAATATLCEALPSG